MNKKQAKKLIELYEIFSNGYHRLGGSFVLVTNLRYVREEKTWVCDLESGIIDADGGNTEWLYDIDYPEEALLRIEKEAKEKGMLQ